MQLAFETTVIPDHPCMRVVLGHAEEIWKAYGRPEGVTITHGKDGIHGASSWHYCGCAVDFRTRYWSKDKARRVWQELKDSLPGYDVIWHDSHIHVEPGNPLAKQWGLLL